MTQTVSIVPQRGERTRWVALVVLCVGMLMIVLDATVVNVALPSIQADLGFSQSSLAWVVNAYLISFGGLLLLAGRLGDLFGRKRIFMVGLAAFTGASLLCGLAQSQWLLIAARFVQGAGGAMTSAVILGMIITMFREPRAQGKAIGVYSFVASAGGAVGLLAGGVLTQAINWHWIFFINLPVGIVTAILTVRLIDHDKGIGFERGIDLPGAILAVGALMIGVYSILEAGQYGWASPRTLGLAAGALMLLGGFIVREARASNPLMPLRLFRSRNMNGANLVQVLSVAGMFGMFFLGALYLQRVLGFSAMEVGLGFLPVTVVMGALSLGVSGRLTLRFGPRATLVPSLVLIALALALLARAPVGGTYLRDVLPVLLLLGTGAGIGFPALMTLAMSGSSRSDAGLASGLVNTSAQVGGAVGLAVLATLSATRTEQLLARGESTIAALTGGYQLAFIVAAGLMVAAIGVSLAVLRSPNLAEADFAGAVEAESDAA